MWAAGWYHRRDQGRMYTVRWWTRPRTDPTGETERSLEFIWQRWGRQHWDPLRIPRPRVAPSRPVGRAAGPGMPVAGAVPSLASHRATERWPEPRLGGRAQQPHVGPGGRAGARVFLRPPPSRRASLASLWSRSRVFSSLQGEGQGLRRGLGARAAAPLRQRSAPHLSSSSCRSRLTFSFCMFLDTATTSLRAGGVAGMQVDPPRTSDPAGAG